MTQTEILCSKCKASPPIPSRKWCLSCCQYSNNAKKKFRANTKPEGTCKRSDCNNLITQGYASCDSCRSRVSEYEVRNKTKLQFAARQSRRRRKLKVFDAYGGPKCACCGEDQFEFLTMDHIDGSGAEHRRQLGTRSDIYTWLKKNNFPPGFRVLCMNCNFALGYHGYCPHHGWVQPTNNGRLGRKQKETQ